MPTAYFTSVKTLLSSIFLSLAVLTGYTPLVQAPAPAVVLGDQIAAVADFRSSLATGISSSATTMTLVSFTSGSDSLVVGEKYGFKIGGQEYVIGTASTNNSVINMTRGLSRRTGTSTIASYQQQWGRGTAVEQTDAPLLLDVSNKITGKAGFDNLIHYASNLTVASDTDIVSKKYVDNLAFSGAGVIDASATARGISELATSCEAASSTAQGGSGVLVIPTAISTSTYLSSTQSACRVLVTQNDGKLDSNFLSTTTLLSTSSIQGTAVGTINKISQTFTAIGTSTFAVPLGIRRVSVRLVAGGGGGGGSTGATAGAGGGGAGAYAEKQVDVTGTTSIQVIVGQGGAGGAGGGSNNGAAGLWSTFGTNGQYFFALPGLGGTGGAAGQGGVGGATSTAPDFSSAGGGGQQGGNGGTAMPYAFGGASIFGSGNNPSGAVGAYGAGGYGASANAVGGAGMAGAVIVTW